MSAGKLIVDLGFEFAHIFYALNWFGSFETFHDPQMMMGDIVVIQTNVYEQKNSHSSYYIPIDMKRLEFNVLLFIVLGNCVCKTWRIVRKTNEAYRLMTLMHTTRCRFSFLLHTPSKYAYVSERINALSKYTWRKNLPKLSLCSVFASSGLRF